MDYLFFVWDSSIFGSIEGMAKVVEKGFYADETVISPWPFINNFNLIDFQ